jgi:hypothetical protein
MLRYVYSHLLRAVYPLDVNPPYEEAEMKLRSLALFQDCGVSLAPDCSLN